MPDIHGDEDTISSSENEEQRMSKAAAELADEKEEEEEVDDEEEEVDESETSSVIIITGEGTATMTTTGKKRIDVPDSGDVLFGRGKPYQNHGGNTVSEKTQRRSCMCDTQNHTHTDTHFESYRV
jgi:hypothetical protein